MRTPVSRRQFIGSAGLAALGAAAVPGAAVAALTNKPAKEKTAPPAAPVAPPAVARRTLGKSGLDVSVISIGTGGGQAPNLLRYCISKGVNFIHTSTGYKGGSAIKNVGEAIKGQRDKVVLALKITWEPSDIKALDRALASLGVESVDLALYNIHNRKEVTDPKYAKAAVQLKKSGKIKSIGLTTHGDMAGCMAAALDEGFYDVLMPSYNMSMKEECAPVFERAAKDNVGIMLMKAENQLGTLTFQKAIPLYLELPAVATINKTISSFKHCEDLLAAVATPVEAADRREVERIARIAMAGHCTMCGVCTAACPHGVAVADLVRCSDYYLNCPDHLTEVEDTLAGLPASARPQACRACGACETACPQHLPIRHHLHRVATALA